MARKKLIRSEIYPYHVTARCNNREPFPLALTFIWKIAVEELSVIQALYRSEIQAFVLMPNHFHLLITTPVEDLGQVMQYFMSNLTKRINILGGRSGRIFGAPYSPSLITSPFYYGHAFKYVYRNPVKANLCNKIEDYEFSTARGALGYKHLELPLHRTRTDFESALPDYNHLESWLGWLNQPFPKELELLIQKSMQRKKMKMPVMQSSRRGNYSILQKI